MSEMTTITARISSELIAKAKGLDINVSKACRDGIAKAIEKEEKIRELGL